MEFNFELMCELAKTNPEHFADIRSKLLTNALNQFDNKVLGKSMQFSLDSARVCNANKEHFYLTLVEPMINLSTQLLDKAKTLKQL